MLLACTILSCSPPAEAPEQAPPEPVIAPQPQDPTGDVRAGGTLRIGVSQDPASIDPRFVDDPDGERIVGALFDPLVEIDSDGEVVGAAAEHWEVLDGGARFRFILREAAFHDGSPVTATSFKRAFDAIGDGTAARPSFLAYLLGPVVGADTARSSGGPVVGVEVVDSRTLDIHLAAPQPGYLWTLTHPSLVPLPEAAFEDPEQFAVQPIGNGPFAMIEPREPGAFLRLTAFPDHHQPPLLDEVVVQVYVDDPGDQNLWRDLQDGQLQIAEIPPARIDEAITSFGVSADGYRGPGLLTGVTSTSYLYGFDTTQEPYDDPRVRRAISLAIDREYLAETVMQGTRIAATSLVPPSIPGSRANACDHCRHDPAAARDLLEEGDIELAPLTISHLRGQTHAAIAQSMASDIESALGIDVELQGRDLQGFVRDVRAGELPFFWLGWEASEPRPGSYLYPLFHSSQVGADNVANFTNETVDGLLEDARRSSSEAAADYFFRRAESEILQSAPMLPLLWHRHALVVDQDVRDLYWSPLGRVDLAEVWLADRS